MKGLGKNLLEYTLNFLDKKEYLIHCTTVAKPWTKIAVKLIVRNFYKDIEHFSLHGKQLKTFPIEICTFTSLQTLDLCRNGLTKLPAEIGGLIFLRYLDLSDNQLTELPTGIGTLTSLRYLDLRFNQLTTLPIEIGVLENNGCRILKDINVVFKRSRE